MAVAVIVDLVAVGDTVGIQPIAPVVGIAGEVGSVGIVAVHCSDRTVAVVVFGDGSKVCVRIVAVLRRRHTVAIRVEPPWTQGGIFVTAIAVEAGHESVAV